MAKDPFIHPFIVVFIVNKKKIFTKYICCQREKLIDTFSLFRRINGSIIFRPSDQQTCAIDRI